MQLFQAISKIEIPKAHRRGAIIVLSMLAKAKMDIVQEKTDLLLRVGLGSFGRVGIKNLKKKFKDICICIHLFYIFFPDRGIWF